jgi:hypothetical protein
MWTSGEDYLWNASAAYIIFGPACTAARETQFPGAQIRLFEMGESDCSPRGSEAILNHN